MFANITWKKFFATLCVLGLLVGMGYATKYAEDGQFGSDNVISRSIFIFSGFGAMYALGVLAVLLRRERPKKEDDGQGEL